MDNKLAKELIRELRGIRKALEGEQEQPKGTITTDDGEVIYKPKAGEKVRI